MPAGIETSPEVVAQFRAHYLYSGNASESARKVGLPERTGNDIARTLIDDADFAADRRRLRASALEELTAMRLRVARRSLERFEDNAPDAIITATGAVVVPDRRADFGKLVLDAEKNAHALAKIDDPKSSDGDKPVEVHVHLKTGTEPDAGG